MIKIVLSDKQLQEFLSRFIEETHCIIKERKYQVETEKSLSDKAIKVQPSYQNTIAI